MRWIRCIHALCACLALSSATGVYADTLTFTGAFTADDSVFSQTLNLSSMQVVNVFTTSYGGGLNLDHTSSLAGGFVPVVTLFSDTSGLVVGFGGGSGSCEGSSMADPSTGLCEDASFSATLGPGSYSLFLTQFPNSAIGSLSDGFLFAGQSSFTGDFCGVSGGTFLQSDVAPCVQRTGDYTLNVSTHSPIPEPPTWLLVLPASALALLVRRQLA